MTTKELALRLLAPTPRLIFVRFLYDTDRIGDFVGCAKPGGGVWARDPDICCRVRIAPSPERSPAGVRGWPTR